MCSNFILVDVEANRMVCYYRIIQVTAFRVTTVWVDNFQNSFIAFSSGQLITDSPLIRVERYGGDNILMQCQ